MKEIDGEFFGLIPDTGEDMIEQFQKAHNYSEKFGGFTIDLSPGVYKVSGTIGMNYDIKDGLDVVITGYIKQNNVK